MEVSDMRRPHGTFYGTIEAACVELAEDSQYFSREEMISLLATWMKTRPIFGFALLLVILRDTVRCHVTSNCPSDLLGTSRHMFGSTAS